MYISDEEARRGIEAQGLSEDRYRELAGYLNVPGAHTAPIGEVMATVLAGDYRKKAALVAQVQRLMGDKS